MSQRATVIERAFELATSGQERGLSELIMRLKREGYSTDQIYGPMLRRQLSGLIKAARSNPGTSNLT